MKWFFILLIFFVSVCESVAVAAASSHLTSRHRMGDVTRATTLPALVKASSIAASSRRRARACEIQTQQSLPPSLCYPSKEEARLDLECVQRSRMANHLPTIDDLTSEICRSAIETRAKDLAYAMRRNASR